VFEAHALWQAQCAATVTTTTILGHVIAEARPDNRRCAVGGSSPLTPSAGPFIFRIDFPQRK